MGLSERFTVKNAARLAEYHVTMMNLEHKSITLRFKEFNIGMKNGHLPE